MAAGSGGSRFGSIVDAVASLVLLVVLLGGWQFALSGSQGMELVPSPSQIASAIYQDIRTGVVFRHLYVTFSEVMLGFIVATLFGIVLGSLIALLPPLERILYPYIIVIQIIPKVAIAPLIIIWLGYGISSIATIVALVAFFPILVNVIAGMKSADAKQIMLMRSFGAGGLEILRRVRIPSAVPYILAGLDIAVVFAVIGAVVGEFIGASEGLGSLIVQRQYAMNVPGVFSAIVFLSALGVALYLAMKLLSRRAAFWSQTDFHNN